MKEINKKDNRIEIIRIISIFLLYLFLDKIKDRDYKIIKYICPYIFGIYLVHI